MAIYAIGDLHFSGDPATKPMDKFGENWTNHRQQITAHWQSLVKAEDTVVLCGDISWSLDLEDAIVKDLDYISTLPGKKIILKGNHDYWWTSVGKMQKALGDKFTFLHNSFVAVGDTAICGTRGWNLPTIPEFSEHDEAMYRREAMRLEHSLEAAKAAGFTKYLVALHYPPLYKEEEPSIFTEICSRYGVKICVYGHIHGGAAHALNIFQGNYQGTHYRLVACDFIDFTPFKIEI